MSGDRVEAVARELCRADGWADIDQPLIETGEPMWSLYTNSAEAILADPSRMLAALRGGDNA